MVYSCKDTQDNVSTSHVNSLFFIKNASFYIKYTNAQKKAADALCDLKFLVVHLLIELSYDFQHFNWQILFSFFL